MKFSYFHWLLAISAVFVLLERLFAWRKGQRSLRAGWLRDLGIVFSIWDFVFGTAYWPRERSPERLGYAGVEEMPATFHGQVLWPATRSAAARPPVAESSSV